MSSNPDAVVAPRHLFLLDACAAPAADLVKAALLQSCRAVFPTATPHVIAADSGVERQRLCIYTATRSVASILDTAVAADYICFVVHVSNSAQHQTYEPTSSLTLPALMLLSQAAEDMDACARSALAALRVQVCCATLKC